MPLGSNKFFVKNITPGDLSSPPAVTLNLSESYSGESTTGFTTDYSIISYNITSNLANTTLDYEIVGNVSSSDFTDATLSGNITTDSNGNATLTKTIVTSTGAGHKDFICKINSPIDTWYNLATSNSTYLYEMIPANISGGTTTTTTNVVVQDYSSNNVLVSHKIHLFEILTSWPTRSANITITDYGNYNGNANVWENQYMVGNADSYWQDGIKLQSLLIAGGGLGGTTGAGELGVLHYPLSNVSPGDYRMTTGNVNYNSVAFSGNATLSRTSAKGGGFPGDGGSGAGGSMGPSGFKNPGNAIVALPPYETDLAYSAYNVSYPDNFKEFVYFAAGCDGGNASFAVNDSEGDGGGGAFGVGGAYNPSATSPYGLTINKGTGIRNGGHGISWANNRDYPQSNIGIAQNVFPHRWYENPLYDGTNSVTDIAGGQNGYKNGPGNPGVGQSGYGGGNSPGVVTISYPYRPAYRFITNQDLS